jgi:hypothetical protein
MRFQKIQEEEEQKRQGATWRTLIMVIWFGIAFYVAYIGTEWIFENGWITYEMFYGAGLSRSFPQIAIRIVLMLIIVTIFQIFLFLGFAIAAPKGRRRSGVADMHSYNKDPFDNDRF